MALKVSRREMGSWKEKAMRARARLKSASKKADRVVEQMVHTAEVGSAAFIAGVVQGRTGGVEVVGVPLDLGLAAGLHVLAFMGVGGRMSSHLHGFGDGFLAAFLATTGRGVGQSMLEKEKAGAGTTPAKTSGLPGGGRGSLPSRGAYLTDDERMAAMAASI